MKKQVENQVFGQGMCFYKLFWIFIICSILGWCIEVLWSGIKLGHFENRSSLIYGPMGLAYGIGGVLMTLVINNFRADKWWVIFLANFILGTVAEYIMSLGMEICFGYVAWDYSKVPLNINGRVCLLYSLFWGFLGLAWVKWMMPFFDFLVEKVPYRPAVIITWILLALFLLDCIISIAAGARRTERDNGIEAKNNIEIFLDKKYPDEFMQKVFPNSVSVNKDK